MAIGCFHLRPIRVCPSRSHHMRLSCTEQPQCHRRLAQKSYYHEHCTLSMSIRLRYNGGTKACGRRRKHYSSSTLRLSHCEYSPLHPTTELRQHRNSTSHPSVTQWRTFRPKLLLQLSMAYCSSLLEWPHSISSGMLFACAVS